MCADVTIFVVLLLVSSVLSLEQNWHEQDSLRGRFSLDLGVQRSAGPKPPPLLRDCSLFAPDKCSCKSSRSSNNARLGVFTLDAMSST